MKPLAIIPVYNEADILPWTIKHLKEQGCEVYVLNDWSDDGSVEIAESMCSRVETRQLSARYEWTEILKRCEEIALEQCGTGRWVMVNDADEIRRVPRTWGLRLSDGFTKSLYAGYNAIKFNAAHFWPVNNDWDGSQNPEEHFKYYSEDGPEWTHIKAWYQEPGQRVNIHRSGGHVAKFRGCYVYPVPFDLKHYPLRSQEHGERKVLRERLARYSPEELARGWHHQYNAYKTESPNFLRDPKELKEWTP